MPRIETCPYCHGAGLEIDSTEACGQCAGNGYLPATEPDDVSGALEASVEDFVANTSTIFDQQIDLTNDTPVTGRMANQTWRILEEQRQAAEDTIRECDAEIERWANKQSDAIKTKRMCEAGQAALEGGA